MAGRSGSNGVFDKSINRDEHSQARINQLLALGFHTRDPLYLADSTNRVPFLIERGYHCYEWRSLMDDVQLLREYAARDSEAAFEQIVDRHINLVYSTALRQVRDPQLAQEVTQAAFILLAKKARSIREGTILSGWLFKTARFAAMRALRSELRRQHYEHTATQLASANDEAENEAIWRQMAPLLDEAMSGLGERDRQAVLLRFFENKSLKEVGKAPRQHGRSSEETRRPRGGKTEGLFLSARRHRVGGDDRRGACHELSPSRAHRTGGVRGLHRRGERSNRRGLNSHPRERHNENDVLV